MGRSLSAAARRAIFAPQTGEVFAILLTLSHPSWSTQIRVNPSGADLVSGGETYQQFPFEFSLPADVGDAAPTVQLRICNIDRSIVQSVRSVTGDRITVTASIVLASSPDTVEAGPFTFTLRDVSYDAMVVEGTLAWEDVLNEPYPGDAITPNTLPGIF